MVATTYNISLGSGLTVIDNFRGAGSVVAPGGAVQVDTLKFDGAGMTAENMRIEQVEGGGLMITFDGIEGSNASVLLTDFYKGHLGNDLANPGVPYAFGNILFNGETETTRELDVQRTSDLWNTAQHKDALTFLNNSGSEFWGLDNSNDIILAGINSSIVHGGSGDDNIRGGKGADLIYGDDGRDVLKGGTGHDTILGGKGNDYMWGQNGNDTLNGETGTDRLYGGGGVDTLYGGGSADLLWGEGGNDRLFGGEGDDLLWGGQGNDKVDGAEGNDRLIGQEGHDRLTGGTGNDTFEFDTVWQSANGWHAVEDFAFAEDTILFRGLGDAPADFEAWFDAHVTQMGNNVRIEDDSSSAKVTLLGVDADDLSAGNFAWA